MVMDLMNYLPSHVCALMNEPAVSAIYLPMDLREYVLQADLANLCKQLDTGGPDWREVLWGCVQRNTTSTPHRTGLSILLPQIWSGMHVKMSLKQQGCF